MMAGDEHAFRSFHAAYFERLARYLRVVADGDEQLVRDALQDAFRRVVKNIRVFSSPDVFWSWLTVLGRTAVADERRKTRRYARFIQRFWCRAAPLVDTHDAATEEQLAEALDRAVAALPVDERRLVGWKYYDRFPVAAIAGRLGTTEGAIESRLVRIRRKLKANIVSELNDGATP